MTSSPETSIVSAAGPSVLTSVAGAVVAAGSSVTAGAAPHALATIINMRPIKEIFSLLTIRILLTEIGIFGKLLINDKLDSINQLIAPRSIIFTIRII